MSTIHQNEIARILGRWHEEGTVDVETVLQVIFDETVKGEKVCISVIMGEEDPEGDEVDVTVLHINGEDNKSWLPVFTDTEQASRGGKTTTAFQPLKTMMRLAAGEEDCAGITIDPWGNCISIPRDVIIAMLEVMDDPQTQEEKDLNEGAAAYAREDYEKAFELYSRAAKAGDVTALSNLGYCYYYGRSVEKDKAKAKMCWEKAAFRGDICALYKIGDMYRNGDLPKDEDFAGFMYRKAYITACESPDIHSYPDACLRIVKYCADDYSDLELVNICQDAVSGFQVRMQSGDPFAEELYIEAVEIMERISG